MRANPRPRRPISAAKLAVLKPILRYSYARDAYVLRVIGRRFGPVYRLASHGHERAANADSAKSTPAREAPADRVGA